ncbi:pyridoxamine 5'-phosphate oxidase [Streptosporangium becharense]|uniref:Pyridoxamine 5'-phosphate oxidase n=1 Tax=Streptosporangium becharense TaxID=1816182 RepID=A0A7W9IKE1_9ACTN|nr:phenazine biosynthesis FMN-dependent oxidase PhzG [Streptosporangium becharense]MBB2911041.1 pyridoxamine 5'-phosphate oxidase [Streptosporangium becharense]MBB5821901.1 pyridoxamine 5'-phosphate oxidase [Streptosporangium becharense]
MNTSRFETLTAETDLGFPEYETPPPEPTDLIRRWLAEAADHGVREPRSLALATADALGHASNRIVTFTGFSRRGLVFTSHRGSRKGRELAATGWASGLFYWRETGRQLILSGPVTRLGDAESDALWAARAAPLHPMSAASRQSEPLTDVPALREEARRLAETGGPLPRPDRFAGYLLSPADVEFWSADPDRLHRRLRYSRRPGGWCATRLQP